jgi:N-acylneuraminate cytidylyltransferase
MIGGRKVLAVIPARGGSKGVPRKNIREVGGRPLIAWTIEEARKSKYIDRLVLSSDDAEIIAVARSWGCEAPFVRPAELARDESPGIDPVLHAMEMVPGFDWLVLLQATSPLRTVDDIDGCLERCAATGADACVSVTPAEQSPYWMFTLGNDGRMRPLLPASGESSRRQDLPPAYLLNGAVYVAGCEWLRRTKTFVTEETIGFVMPPERSLDIDTERDLQILDIRHREVTHGVHQEAG